MSKLHLFRNIIANLIKIILKIFADLFNNCHLFQGGAIRGYNEGLFEGGFTGGGVHWGGGGVHWGWGEITELRYLAYISQLMRGMTVNSGS